ncbi:MAG: hypothetical protein KBC19_00870 [Candidatus Moranbacteria bacterium]|nr:hypothetical protein [Candidatus Moranbacteria bacterium]
MTRLWQNTAGERVDEALCSGLIDRDNHDAIIAAWALLMWLRSRAHPSYSNTGFAIVACMPQSDAQIEATTRRMAFDLVVNGLSGYFQWVSHNGGRFSIANALILSGVITAEEANRPEQFQIECAHEGCGYFQMTDAFLARIVGRWHLPVKNPALGGRRDGRAKKDNQQLKWLKSVYPSSSAASDGLARIKSALARV